MKCAICGEREAEFIVATEGKDRWQLECKECDSSGYWISIDDYLANKDHWINHLSRKNWFNLSLFMAAVDDL